ncbi:MAG: hypothetical protein HY291_21135 [Planctomycetes bacterium]|nr:hypothetical protein [Planctomycetota bacterium]
MNARDNSNTISGPTTDSSREDDASYKVGPRLSVNSLGGLAGLEEKALEGATWRGWVIGLLATAGLSLLVPYADFVMLAANFSFNSFPMLPMLLLLGLILCVNLTVYALGTRLGLKKQDLVLVCCMTTVVFAIPGVQFWTFWSTGVTAPYYYARPENRWAALLQPYLTPGFFPTDPADPNDLGPRPVEWFYSGLPPGRSIPWSAWAGPYLHWIAAVAFMYGIWFGVSALLQRRWSEHERLPFPISQVPAEMLAGFDDPTGQSKGIFSQKLFWWGVLGAFLAHGLNGLNSFFPNVPTLNLMNWNVHTKYLTEPPWKYIGALHLHIYLSIIGLTYLLSLDVAFSLWFFYWIQKFVNLTCSNVYGQETLNEAYSAQGSGGLLALVLFGFWAGRAEIKQSLYEALGLRTREEHNTNDLSPRAIWLLLLGSYAGAAAWLCWAGVDLHWALLIVMLFVLVTTGLARLIAEAGVFAMQIYNFPVHLLTAAAPPALLGGKNLMMLTIWDRMFTADWFRIASLPNILNSLHLARLTGLRSRTAMSGMAAGLTLMFALSFFTFLGLVYTNGGASNGGWFLNAYPQWECEVMAGKMAPLESWQKKVEAAQGKPIPQKEVPAVAQVDWPKLLWIGVGFVVIGGFNIARRYLFWWPHPAGYVLWMAATVDRLWFSFFLGWAMKWAVSKYGGMRFYIEMRRFFIGLVIGESLAALFWAVVAMWSGHHGTYALQMG